MTLPYVNNKLTRSKEIKHIQKRTCGNLSCSYEYNENGLKIYQLHIENSKLMYWQKHAHMLPLLKEEKDIFKNIVEIYVIRISYTDFNII